MFYEKLWTHAENGASQGNQRGEVKAGDTRGTVLEPLGVQSEPGASRCINAPATRPRGMRGVALCRPDSRLCQYPSVCLQLRQDLARDLEHVAVFALLDGSFDGFQPEFGFQFGAQAGLVAHIFV